ncbi:hypothetical protein DAEQUDRAFT_807903 [Daedalea quercina L-15889]|uniref:Uncharacterized protein n=1 Tax=Daedalea quercina L-15889 TaxID=1314783 RepID=A0A165U114_9APHY|nr:hypothetical protein DAEQUDRAFT_807903 [Daedalea quercina L-15889]
MQNTVQNNAEEVEENNAEADSNDAQEVVAEGEECRMDVPPFIALECFSVEEYQPERSAEDKWMMCPEGRGSFDVDNLCFNRTSSEVMQEQYSHLISRAGPWKEKTKDIIFFGAARLWWLYFTTDDLKTLETGINETYIMQQWCEAGVAIHVQESLDDYTEDERPTVEAFLSKIRDGERAKMKLLAQLLIQHEADVRLEINTQTDDKRQQDAMWDQYIQYCEHLGRPRDDDPEDSDLYNRVVESLRKLTKAVRRGSLDTASDRLRANSTRLTHSGKVGKIDPFEAGLARLKKRKRSVEDEQDDQGDLRDRDGASTSAQ